MSGAQFKSTIRYYYMMLFLLIAFGVSAAVHTGWGLQWLDPWWQSTLLSDYPFLLAALGPALGAFVVFLLDPGGFKGVFFAGPLYRMNPFVAMVPLIVFSITGIANNRGVAVHEMGVLLPGVFFLYALGVEWGWRGYLQHALGGMEEHKRFLLIALLYWLWHMPTVNQHIGPIGMVGIPVFSLFISWLMREMKSVLVVAGIHSYGMLLWNAPWHDARTTLGAISVLVVWFAVFFIHRRQLMQAQAEYQMQEQKS